MPTLVLLTKICCFLNIKEINELSNTCKAIRKKIYSPLGLRVLTGLKSPYPITIIYIDSQENLTRKRVSFEENHYELDDFED